MAAACHCGFSRKAYLDHSARCGLYFLSTHQIDEDNLIGGGDMHASKRNSKKRPLAGNSTSGFNFCSLRLWKPSYVSPCKISAKSDNRRPSYGDSNNSRWPPSAILDYDRKRIWTIPHVAGPHYLCTHRIWWRYLDRRNRHDPQTEIEKRLLSAKFYFRFQLWHIAFLRTFVRFILQNFSQIGRSVAELYRFYHSILRGPF